MSSNNLKDQFFKTFLVPECEERDSGPTNLEVMEKLEKIERKIDLIFGDFVLIDGKFINYKG